MGHFFRWKTLMSFTTFDIESMNWKDYLIGGSFDGKDYYEHKNIMEFMVYIFSPIHPNNTIYAHFGGIFDFLFIFDFLYSQNTNNKKIIPYELVDGSIILQGKKILKFSVKKDKRKIDFVDSCGLFPFSLSKLTKSFNVKHQKLDDIDVSNLTKITPKLRKYLKYDCIGLHECIDKFSKTRYIKDVGIKLTRSGTSFAVFKELFSKELPAAPRDVHTFSRMAFQGGRTEIFKPLYINKKKPIYSYDVNSLYPSVMQAHEMPGDFSHYTVELDLNVHSIYHCRVSCPKEIYIPLLGTNIKVPRRTGSKSMVVKFIFPTGTFDGHWTNVELKKALELGYKIEKIYKGVVFKNNGFMFKEFVDHFYNERKKTSDPVEKIIFKDFMNHLYGRFAINNIRENISLKRTEGSSIFSKMNFGDYEIRLYSKPKKIYTYTYCPIAVFVTSLARLKLYSYFEKCGMDVYYCDTDSIKTPKKIKHSDRLGDVKLEYERLEACYLAPKTYSERDQDGFILKKMKGFNGNNGRFDHINFSDFVESVSGEIRIPSVVTKGGLAGFKTAIRKGNFLTVLPDSSKQLRSKYDKRIINKEGTDSVPLHIEYQELLI